MGHRQLQIAINLDNAAFEDNSTEAARILETLASVGAETLQWLGNGGILRDVNGNIVGGWGVREVTA